MDSPYAGRFAVLKTRFVRVIEYLRWRWMLAEYLQMLTQPLSP